MTTDLALRITQILASVGGLIAALEIMVSRKSFDAQGFYCWRLMRTDAFIGRDGRVTHALDRIFTPNGLLVMTVSRLMLAILLLVLPPGMLALWAVAALLTLTLLFHIRSGYGLDGSDQMQVIVLSGIAAWITLRQLEAMEFAAPLFLAGQAVLAYSTAGWAKARSRVWRSGSAIVGIFNTRSYSHRSIAGLVLDHRAVAVASAWSVIFFETIFPVALISTDLSVTLIIIGVLFHASCAAIMGLNLFFWSFTATYPSIILVARCIERALG